jgi:hypothetical protein
MPDQSAEWRHERIARNEASFRLINERLEASLKQLPITPEPHEFICECGLRSCEETVLLTVAEYESVRAQPDRFVVRPGHVFPEVETVVERHDQYLVVEKHGVAGIISELTSPR